MCEGHKHTSLFLRRKRLIVLKDDDFSYLNCNFFSLVTFAAPMMARWRSEDSILIHKKLFFRLENGFK
jgi:hypothetical protein